MKKTIKLANIFRNNLFFFAAALAMSMGAFTLNSCVKSTKDEMAVSPSPATIIAERGGSQGRTGSADCSNLNMTATTTLTTLSTSTMLERLSFTALAGIDHYEVSAHDVGGTLLYYNSTIGDTVHTFTRPLSFQPITWHVEVFLSHNMGSFVCAKVSKIDGGGISVIVAERVNDKGGSYCPTQQSLLNFYNQNFSGGFALSPATFTTKLVPCYAYNTSGLQNSVSQTQLIASMVSKYGAGATVPIHIYAVDPQTANTCSFSPQSQLAFTNKYVYAAYYTLPISPSASDNKVMNQSIHEALSKSYINYFNTDPMKQYTIAFVSMN
jgi:hypothetical protein